MTQASLQSILHKILTAGPSAFNITSLISQAAQLSTQGIKSYLFYSCKVVKLYFIKADTAETCRSCFESYLWPHDAEYVEWLLFLKVQCETFTQGTCSWQVTRYMYCCLAFWGFLCMLTKLNTSSVKRGSLFWTFIRLNVFYYTKHNSSVFEHPSL